MTTWHILFVILMAMSILVAFIWLRKIDNQVKELVKKNLRKMGFFIVIFVGLCACDPDDPSSEISNILSGQPIVLHPNELQKAGSTMADVFGLQEEQAWRLSVLAFLRQNNTTEMTA